jgi:hypothetical protein
MARPALHDLLRPPPPELTLIGTVWAITKDIGSLLGLAGGVALTAYYAIRPIRKAVDTWIERRIGSRFDKELEDHRHSLRLDAENVRADHQRRLHDFSLSSLKKHEIYAEAFRLLLIAEGALAQLSGGRVTESYDEHSGDDMLRIMTGVGFTAPQKAAVLRDWDTDRRSAMKAFNGAMHNVEMANARAAMLEANNYTLVNSLYLSEPLWKLVTEILSTLNKGFAAAMYPTAEGFASEQRKLKLEVAGLVERLKCALRDELEPGAVAKKAPELGPPPP